MTGRFYKVDGERLVSVTTVLGVINRPGLNAWRARLGNDEADRIGREAAGIGTAVHKLCELLNLGQEPDELTPEVAPFFLAYRRWLREHVAAVLHAEKLVISRTHGFAGTVDLVAVLHGDDAPVVLDIKTANTDFGLHEWGLQTAAYALALAEEGVECARRVIVRLPKTEPGKLHVHELPPERLMYDQHAFRAALALYRWQTEAREKPRTADSMRINFKRGFKR